MTASASMPVVSLNDHAAAACLIEHADATALVVWTANGPGRPVGIITRADLDELLDAAEESSELVSRPAASRADLTRLQAGARSRRRLSAETHGDRESPEL